MLNSFMLWRRVLRSDSLPLPLLQVCYRSHCECWCQVQGRKELPHIMSSQISVLLEKCIDQMRSVPIPIRAINKYWSHDLVWKHHAIIKSIIVIPRCLHSRLSSLESMTHLCLHHSHHRQSQPPHNMWQIIIVPSTNHEASPAGKVYQASFISNRSHYQTFCTK